MARRTPVESPSPTTGVSPEVVDLDLADDEWLEPSDVMPVAPPKEPERRVWDVSEAAHGQRLDVFLVSGASEFSRNHLKHLVEEGCVEVDGKVANSASRKVLAGQRVAVLLKPTAQSQAFVPEPMDLPIVFEDEHLLVVNKPAGWVVHPAAGNWTGTLMNGLLAHHAGAVNLPRAGIVHRLDKDTSGLMVVGKTLAAVTALTRAIAAREVSRQYLALVHGMPPESFTVESSIGRDPVTRIKMAVVPSGKPARTDVQRLLVGEWAPASPAGKGERAAPRSFSGVLCTLHTGRTHQIRVHLSSRRYPLVADALYGGAQALGMTRQALHAARLSFLHPIKGELLKFEAPLPEDMAQAWALLSDAGGAV
ncbi:MAG: RluA family pseudouridine synthase [Aquabacterium sp.]|uniref:RluA family pseudouridine synthase n=1 Tax=Aquabacterium sp. TaxID=1872578 RepID=UPI0025BB3670|nr:RluA family pseudouridine synthase [Aquabacterium sp.]MBI3383073.1 RluA family pseudouridine synthase [Aquabacterium sp.]